MTSMMTLTGAPERREDGQFWVGRECVLALINTGSHDDCSLRSHSCTLSTHSRVPACRQVQSSHQHAASERSISTFMKLFLSLLKIHDSQEEINHTALKSVYRLLREKNQLGSDLVCLIELLISWRANGCVCVCESAFKSYTCLLTYTCNCTVHGLCVYPYMHLSLLYVCECEWLISSGRF